MIKNKDFQIPTKNYVSTSYNNIGIFNYNLSFSKFDRKKLLTPPYKSKYTDLFMKFHTYNGYNIINKIQKFK